MLPFTLIGQPDNAAALEKLSPARDLDLLVVYHGELALRSFLQRILGAAGYQDPGTQLHLLEWPQDTPLDLASLVRVLNCDKVIVFGYALPQLGLHLAVANYFPIAVAGTTYLIADSLEYISQTKEAGDHQAAGALWTAMKEAFLR